jgi:hypothetical protein
LFSHGKFIKINNHRASEVHINFSGCATGQRGQWHLTKVQYNAVYFFPRNETNIKRNFILFSLKLTKAIIGR